MNYNITTVTIGMPVYNDKPFLIKSLESILNQTYQNFEIIISDDGSTDGSEQVCRKYSESDNRISYIRQEKNIGIQKNMMFLLSQSKTEYFMWAGNDDLWDKDFIKILISRLENNPKAIVAFTPYTFIDENDNIIDENKIVIEDYTSSSPVIRLKKFISNMSDGFGYGIYRREMISDMKFPVWWSINKITPYNNIYPTLFYCLSKGEYEFHNNNILWFNRLKNKNNINHKLPFANNFYKGYLAFVLRKFNLAFISTINVYEGSKKINLTIYIMPFIFYSLFFRKVFLNFKKRKEKFKEKGAEIFI